MKVSIKKAVVLILAFALLAGLLAACGGGGPAVEDDKKVEILVEGWINQSVPNDPAKNPYKKFIDDTYDINSVWTNTGNLSTTIMQRYTSQKAAKPHVIIFRNRDFTLFDKYYKQGMFVEDYTPYFNNGKLPTYKDVYDNTPAAKMKYTEGGKITGLTYGEEPDSWQHKIRKDWVIAYFNEHFGETGHPDENKLPSTPEELLTMARAVKAASTPSAQKYMFTAAGKEEDDRWFGLMDYLQLMWAPREFYIDGNEVKHPILTGDRQKFLDFMKTVVSEGLIDPNWETQKWQAHKANIYADKIGMPYFPPEVVSEAPSFKNGSHAMADVWVNMPMPKDSASPLGGFEDPSPTFNYTIAITKEGASNPAKLEKIFKLLEGWLYDSETYWAMRWGVGSDNFRIMEEGEFGKEMEYIYINGVKTDYLAIYRDMNKSTHQLHTYYGMVDYGAATATKADKVVEFGASVVSNAAHAYGNSGRKFVELQMETIAYKKTNPLVNYMEMLKLDPSKVLSAREQQSVYEMMYIKGQTSQAYASFVSEWRNAGGDALLAQATQQFKASGLIT